MAMRRAPRPSGGSSAAAAAFGSDDDDDDTHRPKLKLPLPSASAAGGGGSSSSHAKGACKQHQHDRYCCSPHPKSSQRDPCISLPLHMPSLNHTAVQCVSLLATQSQLDASRSVQTRTRVHTTFRCALRFAPPYTLCVLRFDVGVTSWQMLM
jgi:hypothetical protein